MQLLLTEKVTLGIPVVVHVDAQSNEAHHIQNITVPSLEDGEDKCCNVKTCLTWRSQMSLNILSCLFLSVCSMKLERTVKECDGKRWFKTVTHQVSEAVLPPVYLE